MADEIRVLGVAGSLRAGSLNRAILRTAQAAMSFVLTKSEEYGLPQDFSRKSDIHVHVPEGAIPKDGPSAGITLATTLVSALARVPIRKDVAMTGEITLRGKVLPIGGVKEKVLAAHRAGIKNIVLPKDNEKDLADIPKNVLDTLNVYLVQTMDEVLKIALAGPLGQIATATQAEPNAIIDDAGRILPSVLAARRRGVLFDVGYGRVGHVRWDVVERILKAGFWPDTISTDWNADSKTTSVVDLPNCMSKLFTYGMSVSDAVACVTSNAARTFPVFRDRGTLKVGAVADIALLRVMQGEFGYWDNNTGKVIGEEASEVSKRAVSTVTSLRSSARPQSAMAPRRGLRPRRTTRWSAGRSCVCAVASRMSSPCRRSTINRLRMMRIGLGR